MRWLGKRIFVFALAFLFFSLLMGIPVDSPAAKADHWAKPNASMDLSKFPDMSDFDPNNPVVPHGDTIKIALVAPFSGPAAINGNLYFVSIQWVAQGINKNGGIWVDGKKKMVEIIKADTKSSPDATKKICERMVLQEKVHMLMGTPGSHLMKIVNQVAQKYNVISVCFSSNSETLQDATNFSRNAFMTTFSTSQAGKGLAYYYGKIRKKEKKFYILCQDYSFGRELAAGFKQGLKEYYPEAEIVGEDYHRLFLTDFAPFLTKIKASGAEVIFTGDWLPDGGTLLKQSRHMGVNLPFANIFITDPVGLTELGVEGTEGLVNFCQSGAKNPAFKNEVDIKYSTMWHDLWKNKWQAPYNSIIYEWPLGDIAFWIEQTFWTLSVIERAKSMDPEKIINVWEGDTYKYNSGKVVKMRACDHKVIQSFHVYEYVRPDKQKVCMNIPPYYWSKDRSAAGPVHVIPAEAVLPWMDPKLDRCKGKNNWGE